MIGRGYECCQCAAREVEPGGFHLQEDWRTSRLPRGWLVIVSADSPEVAGEQYELCSWDCAADFTANRDLRAREGSRA